MLKRRSNSTLFGVMLAASFYFFLMPDAQAYLDPGSSSYFFQLLIAGLTAVVYFFSSIKRRVLQLFGKKEAPVPVVEKSTEIAKPTAPDPENASAAR